VISVYVVRSPIYAKTTRAAVIEMSQTPERAERRMTRSPNHPPDGMSCPFISTTVAKEIERCWIRTTMCRKIRLYMEKSIDVTSSLGLEDIVLIRIAPYLDYTVSDAMQPR
jgi:hypothetical protein